MNWVYFLLLGSLLEQIFICSLLLSPLPISLIYPLLACLLVKVSPDVAQAGLKPTILLILPP